MGGKGGFETPRITQEQAELRAMKHSGETNLKCVGEAFAQAGEFLHCGWKFQLPNGKILKVFAFSIEEEDPK